MKIHYKTIVLDEESESYSYPIIEVKRKRWIEYCCKSMEQAIDQQIIEPQNKDLYLREMDSYDAYMEIWYFHPLKFCPFCGEIIEQVEEYKAKLVSHTVHIPKKTAPARKEIRDKTRDEIAKWVLDGGLTCIGCQPDDGGNLDCERADIVMCPALKEDIDKLLAIKELAIIDRDAELPQYHNLSSYDEAQRILAQQDMAGYVKEIPKEVD